VANDILKRVI